MQNLYGRPQQQDGGDKKKPVHFKTTVEIILKARKNKENISEQAEPPGSLLDCGSDGSLKGLDDKNSVAAHGS